MLNKLRLPILGIILTFLLAACGGGSGDGGGTSQTPSAPPTKAIIKLATTGPAGLSMGAISTTINYSTSKGLSISDNDVVASGVGGGATLLANSANTGKVILANLSAAGFPTGEFATLTFTIAPGFTPLAGDFTVDSVATTIYASDADITNISDKVSVSIQSVTFK